MPQNPLSARVARNAGGAAQALLTDPQGAEASYARHANLYGAAKAAAMMIGANPSGVTTSVALAATYVGLCLSNPAGSLVNLVLTRVTGLLNVAPAALTAFGLITGYAAGGITVHTTPLTPINSLINGAAPVGKLDSAATLVGTPAWSRWLGVTPGATSVSQFDTDLQGSIILPPGAYAAIGSLIAGPAAGLLGSFQWEEVPV